MKKFFVIMMVTMFAFSLSSVAFADGSKPQDAVFTVSSSAGFKLTATKIVFENNSSAKMATEKKWSEYTPEEKAAYQASVKEARKRGGATMVVFNETSSSCGYSTLESNLNKWLIKFPNLIIDKKEFLAPAWKVVRVSTYGRASSECTVALVVTYHKKEWWHFLKFWE